MLNTDQYNTQVKNRMIKADFVKNNRGIDGGKDLPLEFLETIFDDIARNEIVLKEERPAAPTDKPKKEVDSFVIESETMGIFDI